MLVATVTLRGMKELNFRYDRTIAEPKPPFEVTFEVQVPVDTPLSPPIHIATSANGWQHVALRWIGPGVARGTLVIPRGEWLDFKYTRGSWLTVETTGRCAEAPNRHRLGATTARTDRVATWRDRCE